MEILETYLLKNYASRVNIWIFSKNNEVIVYGTCHHLFNTCGNYILCRKVLKIETDETFSDINIKIDM